jgi:hypothetical protein
MAVKFAELEHHLALDARGLAATPSDAFETIGIACARLQPVSALKFCAFFAAFGWACMLI